MTIYAGDFRMRDVVDTADLTVDLLLGFAKTYAESGEREMLVEFVRWSNMHRSAMKEIKILEHTPHGVKISELRAGDAVLGGRVTSMKFVELNEDDEHIYEIEIDGEHMYVCNENMTLLELDVMIHLRDAK